MPTVRPLLVLPLAMLMAASSPVFADQQHVVAPSQLGAIVSDHVAKQDADRTSISEALARPEVRDIAASMGVDLSRVEAAASTLTGADLARAAEAARSVNQQLV